MIAKFMSSDSEWEFIECNRISVDRGKQTITDYRQDAILVFAPDDCTNHKRAVLHFESGLHQTVFFGYEAYLLNNDGDTVCAI